MSHMQQRQFKSKIKHQQVHAKSELNRQVDLDREKLKNEIDDLSDDLIKQLESCEKKFKAEYKNLKINFIFKTNYA